MAAMAKQVSATVAKNRLGSVLKMAEEEPVYIVNHGKPQAVVLSVTTYDALAKRARHPEDTQLAALREEFEAMVASMQTDRWRKGVDTLLTASADQLNRIAARRIRKARG
jgi:prevent-host-death family protein